MLTRLEPVLDCFWVSTMAGPRHVAFVREEDLFRATPTQSEVVEIRDDWVTLGFSESRISVVQGGHPSGFARLRLVADQLLLERVGKAMVTVDGTVIAVNRPTALRDRTRVIVDGERFVITVEANIQAGSSMTVDLDVKPPLMQAPRPPSARPPPAYSHQISSVARLRSHRRPRASRWPPLPQRYSLTALAQFPAVMSPARPLESERVPHTSGATVQPPPSVRAAGPTSSSERPLRTERVSRPNSGGAMTIAELRER